MNKNIPQPPSGRGGVQTGLGRTGGPTFGSYARVPGGTSGPRQFGLDAATAGHNRPSQSIGQRRPTQDQPRDAADPYSAPRPEYTAAAEGKPAAQRLETGMGRPGGPRAVGPYAPPMANAPGPGTVETDHTGRQPYAGREPMMTRTAGTPIAARADSDTNPGVNGLRTGYEGPTAASGNSQGSFDSRGDQTGSAASEGLRTRNAVRELVRGNGGMPAELEGSVPPGRAGGLRTSYESHAAAGARAAGGGAAGIAGPGRGREPGMESHG